MKTTRILLGIVGVAVLFGSSAVRAQRAMPMPGRGGRGGNAAVQEVAWNSLEMVFTGKLESVQRGPVGMSMPPMYSTTLNFTVETVIRGSLKKGQKLVMGHVVRQQDMQ